MAFAILSFALSMLQGRADAARDATPLPPAEMRQWLSLKGLMWRERLSDPEREAVRGGLRSPEPALFEAAVGTLLDHRLRDDLPILADAADDVEDYRREVGREVVAAFGSGRDPVDSLRDAVARGGVAHPAVRRLFVEWIVIDRARSLRAGAAEPTVVQGLELSEFEKALLDLSALPADEAVGRIIHDLAQAQVAGREEYDRAAILATYGRPAVDAALARLGRIAGEGGASPYPAILLLDSLRPWAFQLGHEDAEGLRLVLDRLERPGDPRIVNAVRAFRAVIDSGAAGGVRCTIRSSRPLAHAVDPARIVAYGLRYDDLDRLAALREARIVVPVREILQRVSRDDRAIEGRILATTPDYAGACNVHVARGRFLEQADVDNYENVAVLGAQAARNLFPHAREDPIDQAIRIGSDEYAVVGTLPEDGAPGDPAAEPDGGLDVFIPLSTAKLRFGDRVLVRRGDETTLEEVQLSRIIVQGPRELDAEQLAAVIEAAVGPSHPEKDYEVEIGGRRH